MRLLLLVVCLAVPPAGLATVSRAVADTPAAVPSAPAAEAPAPAAPRLPGPSVTRHELVLPDRTLAFEATASAITITAPGGREEADLAFVAYTIDGEEHGRRPVTFLVNGGPGAASAYLQIGAVGPWLLPLGGDRIVPSQPPDLLPNPDTWLDFTDLVFIDPVGTGFSRLVDPDDRTRSRYLSVDGDAKVLAEAISRWLVDNDRVGSPKYFVGESYGGFRAPIVAQHLRDDHGLALSGLTLVSPVLDFGWWQQPDYAPLPMVTLLPSLAAVHMDAEGTFSEEALRAAEDYAAGDFLADLLRGVHDRAAVERLVDRVSALTGLDRAAVAREDGRIDAGEFARESRRDEHLRTSVYDATVTASGRDRGSDPVLDAMTAPLTSAMLGLYRDTLDWLPNRDYQLLNADVTRGWDWGSHRGQPEAVTDLADLLSLDPALRVLVTHGRTDLVTPYFGTELILRQLDVSGSGDRLRQVTYPGGHMFYTRSDSRRAFRADARALYVGQSG
ncbi:MAG: peptidase S10 [Amaricoccus sp.]|uniref:S10 family peptidase n=1 Tax=Amaricoccus sp. TaxID=1872485 RepID=UPI0039E4DCE5